MSELQDFVSATAASLDVPGVSVGVIHEGREEYAFHGVTSIENPLEVDENTLFQFGSTGKTFTSTALLRLIEQGNFDLDTRVKDVLPELTLKDKSVEGSVTIRQLTNHTSGWSGDVMTSTGDGDDALQKFVALLADVDQVTPLGETVSYSNSALSDAGRVIEVTTGLTYEQAIKELIFEPLGMKHSFFFPNEVMTRRFAVGHDQTPEGEVKVSRPWAMARNGNPAGGISANAADQIAWARFHLGDGTAPDGTRVLSEKTLRLMQEPTADMRGSALGDYVGISWLMRDIPHGDGTVRLVGHGGDTIGQHSSFEMVPERDFAVITMTNCGPNGGVFNEAVVKWALEHYLGIVEVDPEPVLLGDDALAEFCGHYETVAVDVYITSQTGHLIINVEMKPETAKALKEDGATDDDLNQPPIPIGLLPGDGDRYIVVDGPAKGMKGYFARDAAKAIKGAHIGGRMAVKLPS
jgi:CubicO group peptidase (beta-lactamase class C family)